MEFKVGELAASIIQLNFPFISELPSITIPVRDGQSMKYPIGDTVLLRCEGQGIPAPNVNLLHNGLPIISESDDPSVAMKTLVMTPELVGEYLCFAIATFVLPHGGSKREVRFKTISLEVEGEIM